MINCKLVSFKLRLYTVNLLTVNCKSVCIRENPGNYERSGGNFLMHFNGQNKNVLGSKFVWGPYQIISKMCPVQVVTFPDKLAIEITFLKCGKVR